MLDIKLIRKERDKIEALLRRKEPDISLDKVIELDEKIREIKTEDDQIKARRNELSKKIGDMMREGKDTISLKEDVARLSERMGELDKSLKALEGEFTDAISRLPNIPMEDVKVSHKVEENEILKMVGQKPSFSFAPKNHLELNEKLHLFDFERAAKTTGRGWPAYRGWGARL